MCNLRCFIPFSFLLLLSGAACGQTITLSVSNVPIDTVFTRVQEQTPYRFIYTSEELQGTKPVSLSLKKATIETVLEMVFKNQPLTYSMDKMYIILKVKSSRANTAGPVIRGMVTGETGAIEGASVVILHTTRGTITNAKGAFQLPGSEGTTQLVITSVGYEPQVVAASTNSPLTIRLRLATNALDQIEVIAYGVTTERAATGDVATVKSDEIDKQPISNPLEAMEGRMPGVYIQQTSGVSGSGFNIDIRGQNSLRTNPANNGNMPLYIIDGVPTTATSLDVMTSIGGQIIPFSSPLNSIDPANIERIDVLKDADATAIYGSRGANGVVLITTKKGKAGKTKADISAYSGSGKITRTMDLLNSAQYLQMRHEAFSNDQATPQFYDNDLNGTWDTTRYTDWQKTLIGGTAGTSNLLANISGGSQQTQFLLGGGLFRQGTVFPGGFADRKGSAHLNVNHRADNGKFFCTVSVNYVVDNNNLPTQDPTITALTLPPVAPAVYNPDGTLNWANFSWSNPFASFLQPYKGATNNLVADAVLNYQALPGLTIRTSMGYNDIRMQQTSLDPTLSQNPALAPTGSANFGTNAFNSWIIEPQAEYQKRLPGGNLGILLGATFQQSVSQAQSFYANGYTSDALLNDMLAAGNVYPGVSTNNEYRYDAVFARINYSYNDKYLINFTGRRDGSSRFGPGKQFASFGAAGLGWIFTRESFVQKALPNLSFGKIRASYGTTGSDQIGDYGYLDVYAATRYGYNGTSGLTLNRLYNPNFAWETNKKGEVALELGFWKDRLLFTGAYYRNRSSNQLVGYPLPTITGESSLPFYNLPATVQNMGWEFQLNSKNWNAKAFTWSTSFNLTFPENKLLAYPRIQQSSYANTYSVGKSLYTKDRYHYLGIDPQTGLYTFATKSANGGPSYPSDLQPDKQVARTYYGGLDNRFAWRHFQLDVFFQFVRQTGYNYLSAFQSPGTINEQPVAVLNRWQKPGDEKNIQQFSQNYGGNAISAYYNLQYSDATISDASFIRLKNLYLAYSLAPAVLSRLKIKDCRVFVQGQNLITSTKYLGMDPESQSFGNIPPLRVFTAGFQLSL